MGRAAPSLLHRLLAARESSVAMVLLLLGFALYLHPVSETFYSPLNRQNLMLQIALISIFAIGETIVIITGGIDLSLGSLIAFTGMLLALFATQLDTRLYSGAAVGLAIFLTLLVALLIGTLHATLIHRLRLPPFVVTLAALTILQSQSLLMNGNLPISIAAFPFLKYLANGKIFPESDYAIPIPVVILAVIAIVMHLIMTRTRIGVYTYSLGSNETATRLSGVNVGKVKLFAYGTSALLGGVAGILYAGYGGQGDPLSGRGYELNAVAAAVIGGANLMGGQGSIGGTILGACLLRVILSGINLTITNPSLWEGSVVGGVLLTAVLTTALRQRRQTSA
jgi:ribose transport system permease protein